MQLPGDQNRKRIVKYIFRCKFFEPVIGRDGEEGAKGEGKGALGNRSVGWLLFHFPILRSPCSFLLLLFLLFLLPLISSLKSDRSFHFEPLLLFFLPSHFLFAFFMLLPVVAN